MLRFVYAAGSALVLFLPLKLSYRIANIVSGIIYIFARDDRKALAHNLRIALGINDNKIIQQHIKSIFRNFAKYLIDFCRYEKLDSEYWRKYIAVSGKENLDRTLREGKGAISVSAHLGNWELGAAMVAKMGYPLHIIVMEHSDKKINDFFEKQRNFCNVKPIGLGSQLKNCFKVLKNNCVLGIAGDRDFTNTGIPAPFFGHTARLPKGAASLCLKTGASIVPTFLVRKDDDRFELCFEAPIKAEVTGNKEDDIRGIMRKYFLVIEKYVKKYPDQWYAFQRIWA